MFDGVHRPARRRYNGIIGLAIVPVLAIAALLSAPTIGALSLEPAGASACAYANGHPREISRGQARDAVICLINNRRAERGKGRLNAESGLRKSAGRHTRHMKRRNCFSHRCPGEKDLTGRISATAYLPCNCSWGVGENIAWGKRSRGTPAKTVKAWMNSPPHRQTLLDGSYEHVGVGVTWGTPSSSRAKGAVYTANFGFKRG